MSYAQKFIASTPDPTRPAGRPDPWSTNYGISVYF